MGGKPQIDLVIESEAFVGYTALSPDGRSIVSLWRAVLLEPLLR
ncbi:MAG: hypothetical protein QF828_20280 [Pseudomonadales bacterium]|nr:hypothetical protein [Pseudomonadales bacterium]MDP7360746.1 hypothetical protein [Pseudomonadales bacterium]